MKEKSIYRIGKKHPGRSLFISEKDSRNSNSRISHPGENQITVKYKKDLKKSHLSYCLSRRSLLNGKV